MDVAELTLLQISHKQYEQAAADYGGTAGSFKFACYTAFKKLKDNNCYVDGEGGDDETAPAATPKKGKGASKKRKAAEVEEDAGEDDEEVEVEKAPKKARGGKKNMIKAEEDIEEA